MLQIVIGYPVPVVSLDNGRNMLQSRPSIEYGCAYEGHGAVVATRLRLPLLDVRTRTRDRDWDSRRGTGEP